MDQVQQQASKLWELIFSEETGEVYQNTLNLTVTIIKETAQLIWLIICSVFVFGAWAGDTSMKTGNSLRSWIEQQSNPSLPAAEKKPLAETGKSLLETGRTGVDYLVNQAREQLGLEPVEPAPVKKAAFKPATSEPAAPEPTVEKTATAPTAPVSSTSYAADPKPADPKPSAGAPTPDAAISQSAAAAPMTDDVISRESDDGGWPPQAAED